MKTAAALMQVIISGSAMPAHEIVKERMKCYKNKEAAAKWLNIILFFFCSFLFSLDLPVPIVVAVVFFCCCRSCLILAPFFWLVIPCSFFCFFFFFIY
jgi:hypothetical protein